MRCDLLENIYLCGINNNASSSYWLPYSLWFAWKYLPLWYQQQRIRRCNDCDLGCDLLENIYLCGINNNVIRSAKGGHTVVICLKISTFVVSTTTLCSTSHPLICYDLLENIYLCGINNNSFFVICCLSKGYKAVEGNKNGATKRNPTSVKWDFCFLLRWLLMMLSPSFFLL